MWFEGIVVIGCGTGRVGGGGSGSLGDVWCGAAAVTFERQGGQAAALVCSGGKSTLMNWTYLGGTARGRLGRGIGMQLSRGVATSCASGMWKAKHRPYTPRQAHTAHSTVRSRPQHPTRPIKHPLLSYVTTSQECIRLQGDYPVYAPPHLKTKADLEREIWSMF